MLDLSQKNKILSLLLESLELPEGAYQKAEDRYKDIGEWLCREESECSKFEPRIFAQGSFRLGTAIRPLGDTDDYDLDLVAKLQEGLDKTKITQEQLKTMVGKDLENYRNYRGIESSIEPKHRCWCLQYADHMKFHMDIIPCIPEGLDLKAKIKKTLLENFSEELSSSVSELSVSITDDRSPSFQFISNDWEISNPEGYAIWFESRLRLSSQFLNERAILLKSDSVDDLPYYQWKTPLQSAIQILKRHRDHWARNNSDLKPISIIITTLAAMAYNGESDLYSALNTILYALGNFVRSTVPKVPNPTNPKEDFADKWNSSRGKEIQLEENFWRWLHSAQNDFSLLFESDNVDYITEQFKYKYDIVISKNRLNNIAGLLTGSNISIPKDTFIPNSRPWGV